MSILTQKSRVCIVCPSGGLLAPPIQHIGSVFQRAITFTRTSPVSRAESPGSRNTAATTGGGAGFYGRGGHRHTSYDGPLDLHLTACTRLLLRMAVAPGLRLRETDYVVVAVIKGWAGWWRRPATPPSQPRPSCGPSGGRSCGGCSRWRGSGWPAPSVPHQSPHAPAPWPCSG